MKHFFIAILFASCAVTRPSDITLKVSHIQKEAGKVTVYCNRGYMVYRAEFNQGGGADTLKRGDLIKAEWVKDTCQYVFKRIK